MDWAKALVWRNNVAQSSCVSFYPLYFKSDIGFYLWSDLCGKLSEWGEIKTGPLLSSSWAWQIKSSVSRLHLASKVKVPFIWAIGQLNHRKKAFHGVFSTRVLLHAFDLLLNRWMVCVLLPLGLLLLTHREFTAASSNSITSVTTVKTDHPSEHKIHVPGHSRWHSENAQYKSNK